MLSIPSLSEAHRNNACNRAKGLGDEEEHSLHAMAGHSLPRVIRAVPKIILRGRSAAGTLSCEG